MNIEWDRVIGHKKIVQQLQQLQAEDRLPHALLFCGTAGIGKSLAAEALAAALLCHSPAQGRACGTCPSCKALKAGTHPDFFTLRAESKGSGAEVIKIEAVREMQTGISRVPLLSGRRVVIIYEADKLNEPAENCLLKTIEEPSGEAYFILLSSGAGALLDTIISRCMRVEFGILHRGEIAEILAAQGVPEHERELLSNIADGSAARALALKEPELLALRENAFSLAEQAGKMSAIDIMEQAGKMSAHTRAELGQWLGFLAMLYRDMLLLYTGGGETMYNQQDTGRLSAMVPRYSAGKLLALLQLIQEYQKRMQSNANIQLCLEGFYIRLNELAEA